jgi:hypothetical protein
MGDNIKMDLKEVGWGGYLHDYCSSGYGSITGSYEHSNEHRSSTKTGKILWIAQ